MSGRTSPPTTLTERGYTGHHENRDIGLTYMNTRYYIPGLGRFLTADTIVPAPANPQSHNRYTYVLGNPLVLVDPTGHYSCYTHGPNEHCTDAVNPPFVPLWRKWQEQGIRRIYVEGYGLFDLGHINRGYDFANWILGEVRRLAANGGGIFPVVSRAGYPFLEDFVQEYWISGDLTEEEIIGVALAIYMDFEQQYERHQGGRIDAFSSFSPEDLPSNYFGFWAYVNGYSKEQIPALLGQFGKGTPYHGSSMVLGWDYDRSDIPSLVAPRIYLTIPRNYQFKPMARVGTTWRNVEWPHYMHLTLIRSSNLTWQPCRTHPIICGG